MLLSHLRDLRQHLKHYQERLIYAASWSLLGVRRRRREVYDDAQKHHPLHRVCHRRRQWRQLVSSPCLARLKSSNEFRQNQRVTIFRLFC